MSAAIKRELIIDGHIYLYHTERNGKGSDRLVVELYDETLNRPLHRGDINSDDKYPNKPYTTYTKVTKNGSLIGLNSAARRLWNKVQPYYSNCNKSSLAKIYKNEEQTYTEGKVRWNSETKISNKRIYSTHLLPLFEKIYLPITLESEHKMKEYIQKLNYQSKDTLINLTTQFLQYLAQHGYAVGTTEISKIAQTDEEKRAARFSSVKSLSKKFRRELLVYCHHEIDQNTENAPLALGIFLIFALGLRTTEMLAITFEEGLNNKCYYVNKKKAGKGVTDRVKTRNAYRAMVIPQVLRACVKKRFDALINGGLSKEKVRKMPIVCGNNPTDMMNESVFAGDAKKLFLALGIATDMLAHYAQLMQESNLQEIRNESSVCAYILRRDYITRLYNTADLSEKMITYLSAHEQKECEKYNPSRDELGMAAVAIEQYYITQGFMAPPELPAVSGHAYAPVLCRATAHCEADSHLTLSPAETDGELRIIIRGAPGTQIVLESISDTPPRHTPMWLPDDSGK